MTAGLSIVTGTCSGYVVCEIAWVKVEYQWVCNKVNQVEAQQTSEMPQINSLSFHFHCLMAVEWRSGLAGHLILSDEDVTSVVQGTWKRLNTLQHYKVRNQSTVALSLLSSSALCYVLSVALAPGGSLSNGWSFLAAAYSN